LQSTANHDRPSAHISVRAIVIPRTDVENQSSAMQRRIELRIPIWLTTKMGKRRTEEYEPLEPEVKKFSSHFVMGTAQGEISKRVLV
jgi:hypothetical protein